MDTNTFAPVPLLCWRAPSRPHHTRSARWYVVMGGAVLALLSYSILTKAWSFTAVIVLGTLLYLYAHREKPSQERIELWDEGCTHDGKFVPWGQCTGFFFVRGRNICVLTIERKGWHVPIRIRSGSVSPVTIRRILSKKLEEKPEQTEALLDIISRICKI